MAGQSSERAELLAHIQLRWPGIPAEEAEEQCHEALSRALATDAKARGATLVANAKAQLVELAKTAFWQKKRLPASSFEALSHEIESSSEPLPRRRRRVGSRTPKGLVPCHGSQLGFQLVEGGTGSIPDDELRLGAFLLCKMVFEGMEAGAAMPRNVGKLSLDLFRRLFGHGPLDVWANVLLNQVAAAKLAVIAPREQARSPSSPRRKPTLMFVDRKDPSKKQREATLRTQLVSQRGPLGVVACYGDLGAGQGEQLITTVTVLSDSETMVYPLADRERAQMVLALTIRALACFPVPCCIPEYALDVELIIWLEMRMGFQSGGGPHSMSKEKLLDLILDAERLATSIESHGKRMASRTSGKAAAQLTIATESMATRVRTRAESAKSC